MIETTEQENKSFISYYDSELKIVNTQELLFGTMGNLYYTPIVYDNKMYTIPQGLGNKKDAGIVISMDLATGDIEEYHIDKLAMNSLALNDEFIFTCNTINGISSINKYDRNTGKVTSIDIGEVYISKIFLKEENLYAFGQNKGEKGKLITTLYTLDESLAILNKKDISSHGSGQYKAILLDESLFFTSATDSLDQPSKKLSYLSFENGELYDINLDEKDPLEIIPYQDKLIISHCNLTQIKGNKLTILDMSDESQEVIEFNHDLLQIQIKDNKFYAIDQQNIYVYQIENGQFILENQARIRTTENEKEFYYVSGFFLK